MKKLLFLALIPLCLQAQAQSTPRILETSGNGMMHVSPDWVSTYLSLTSKGMDYSKVIEKLNEKASALEKHLVMAGFSKEQLKTSSYTVNKNTIWRNGKSIDSGFVGQQVLVLEFDNDKQKIARLVKSLGNSKTDVSFNFGFSLSEKKEAAVENEVLRKAVKDATDKANVLSAAAGTHLGTIQKIAYGTALRPPMPVRYAMSAEKTSGTFAGFDAKDIEVSESVTITWILE